MIDYTLERIAEVTGGKLVGDGHIQIKGVQIDSRIVKDNELFAPVIGERVDGHSFVANLFERGLKASLWQNCSKCEMPKGNLVVVEDTTKALELLALDYRKSLKQTFIGVTGSSGKTSTKDIIAATLSAKYRVYKTKGNQNNEIGVPLTILNIDDESDIAVCEMGISDFNEMESLVNLVKPDMTTIVSIGPSHIMNLKTMDNISIQKCLINSKLGNGQAYYNAEGYKVKENLENMGLVNKPIAYGFTKDCDYWAKEYEMDDAGMSFVTGNYPNVTFHIPVLGMHQVLNALAALAMAKKLGLSLEEVQKGYDSIKLTAHRLELKHINDAVIIDDAYNANPSSMASSLNTIAQYNDKYHKIAVIGDMKELGENEKQLHASLAESVDFSKYERVYLFGELMANLVEPLNKLKVENYYYTDREVLVNELVKEFKEGNVVIFKASNSMGFARLIEEVEAKL